MYNGFYNILRREGLMDLEATVQLFGPFLLGLLVTYFLWGIQVTQSYYYYRSYRKTDRMWLKAAVLSLFIADAAQSICASESAWHAILTGWGDTKALKYVEDSWGTYLIPFMDAFTASIVHVFYAQKIWTLLGSPFNSIFTGLVLCLSCLQLVAGLGWTVFFFSSEPDLLDVNRMRTWSYLWLATGSITDIIITSLLTWKLANSRTGYKDTDDIISKLIRLIVETGLATAIVQILNLVLTLQWPLNTYDISTGMISAKVYSNSMLALLNSRQPREKSGVLHIHNGQTVETTTINIHTHTTQSTDIASDHESIQRQTGKASPSPTFMN